MDLKISFYFLSTVSMYIVCHEMYIVSIMEWAIMTWETSRTWWQTFIKFSAMFKIMWHTIWDKFTPFRKYLEFLLQCSSKLKCNPLLTCYLWDLGYNIMPPQKLCWRTKEEKDVNMLCKCLSSVLMDIISNYCNMKCPNKINWMLLCNRQLFESQMRIFSVVCMEK